MEDKIFRYISRLNTNKVRLTELIAHFTHNISGGEKETIIFKKILPALLNMEKHSKIKLSWDVLLSRYRFPRYIYCKCDHLPEAVPPIEDLPLWQKQIEDILRKEAAKVNKKARTQRLQDKFERFVRRYEKSSEEISPPEDWVKIITAVMETNLSQFDVMRACIEAFKAGAIWQKYRQEFEE